MGSGLTMYSEKIDGQFGNYNWPVRFDRTDDGYLGVSQTHETGEIERVLLSPNQAKALRNFLTKRFDRGRYA